MLRAVAQRIGAALAVLTVVSVAVFLALRVLPGNPATLVLGLEATPERVAALSAEAAFLYAALARCTGFFIHSAQI